MVLTRSTSDRVRGRASYSQPTTLLFPGHNQELQIVEILISEFEGNHFFSQMAHFKIYLWFRVGWERFADHNKLGNHDKTPLPWRSQAQAPGVPGHVDLGRGPVKATSDT